MKYSVILKTARKDPHFEPFFDSYANELKKCDEEFELIIVDSFLWYAEEKRRNEVKELINDRFEYIHTEPKPSNWCGPHKKTRVNFYDGAGAYNTGLIVCNGGEDDYILHMDDCMVMCPGYLSWFIYASKNNTSAHAGCIWVKDLVVDNGIPTNFSPYLIAGGSVDEGGNGWPYGGVTTIDSPFAMYHAGGGGFLGNACGTFFSYYLELNGYDEYTARHNTEDMDMGMRIELLSKKKGHKGIWRFPMARILEATDWNIVERGQHEWQDESYRKEYPQEHYFPYRSFVEKTYENEELNESITNKWDELYHKHSRASGSSTGEWIRLGHIPTEWSKFDLIATRELYRSTGEFPEPNFIDKCPFSGFPLEEL